MMKFLKWLVKYRRVIIMLCVIVSAVSAVMLFHEEKSIETHPTLTATYFTTTQTDYKTDYNTITVYVTTTGTKYHRKYCRYVDGKDNLTELTEEEAILRGYEHCSVCF